MRDRRIGNARFHVRRGRIAIVTLSILMVVTAVSIGYIDRITPGDMTPNREYRPKGKREADLLRFAELRRYTELWKQIPSGGSFQVEVHPSCVVHVYRRGRRFLFCIPDVSNPQFYPCDERYLIDPSTKVAWSGCDVSAIGLNEIHGDLYFKHGGPSYMFRVLRRKADSECIDSNALRLKVQGDSMTFGTVSRHRVKVTG